MFDIEAIIDAEIVPDDTMDDAGVKRLDTKLRLTVETVRSNMTKLQDYVHEAKLHNIHERLGFVSWTAYLADALGNQPLALDREDRRELVQFLSDEGLSTRGIATVAQISRNTVKADLRQVGQTDPPASSSTDRSTKLEQRRKHFNQPKPGTDDIEPVTDLDSDAKIIGLDGKKYNRTPKRPVVTPAPTTERPDVKASTGLARHDEFIRRNPGKAAGRPYLNLHRVVMNMKSEAETAEMLLLGDAADPIKDSVTPEDASEYLKVMDRHAEIAGRIKVLLSSIVSGAA